MDEKSITRNNIGCGQEPLDRVGHDLFVENSFTRALEFEIGDKIVT